MTYTVTVTQAMWDKARDIQNGGHRLFSRSRYCPVALAIQKALNEQDVEVGTMRFTVKHTMYWLPLRASELVLDFDNGRLPKSFPVSFKIGVL